MNQNTIEGTEMKIRENSSFTYQNKIEFLNLFATLKLEMNELSEEHLEHAENITGFIDRSTHEVMRYEKNPELLMHAVDGLYASVKGFEESHPKLVDNVNYIASTLANMGI